MGHDIYITRAPHFLDGAQHPIAKGDWRALVAADPELSSPDPSVPDYAVWNGETSVQTPWIDLADGNLFSRSPDHSFVRKLIAIAGRLGARVQGEGGELYRIEGGLVSLEEPESDEPPPAVDPHETLAPELEHIFRESRLEDIIEGGGEGDDAGTPGVPADPDDPHASFVRAPEDVLARERGGRGPGVPVPFDVGERVRTQWGRLATVVDIDRGAELGLGHIEIKYEDGTTATMSCVAHGLERA